MCESGKQPNRRHAFSFPLICAVPKILVVLFGQSSTSKTGVVSESMLGENSSRHRFARVFALALVFLFVLFFVHVLAHPHQRGQNEAACQACHVGHLLFPLTAANPTFHLPLLPAGSVQPFVSRFHQEFFFEDSSSRAPPTS